MWRVFVCVVSVCAVTVFLACARRVPGVCGVCSVGGVWRVLGVCMLCVCCVYVVCMCGVCDVFCPLRIQTEISRGPTGETACMVLFLTSNLMLFVMFVQHDLSFSPRCSPLFSWHAGLPRFCHSQHKSAKVLAKQVGCWHFCGAGTTFQCMRSPTQTQEDWNFSTTERLAKRTLEEALADEPWATLWFSCEKNFALDN